MHAEAEEDVGAIIIKGGRNEWWWLPLLFSVLSRSNNDGGSRLNTNTNLSGKNEEY